MIAIPNSYRILTGPEDPDIAKGLLYPDPMGVWGRLVHGTGARQQPPRPYTKPSHLALQKQSHMMIPKPLLKVHPIEAVPRGIAVARV